MSSMRGICVFEDPLLVKHAPYDFIKLTPAHLPVLDELLGADGVASLTPTLVVGGEALEQHHFAYLRNASRAVRIVNEYGPTEATVGCSNYSFMSDTDWQADRWCIVIYT